MHLSCRIRLQARRRRPDRRGDLLITTYPLLPRDRERLQHQRFSLLVLDEAQAVKNARSQVAQIVRELSAARRLAMTGPPLENHLGELWARFDAAEPGLLGSERRFNRLYRGPIEKQGESPLFLISLKAGGVGLNLTAADAVVHYDPWWNPAVEQQATDRAHRLGQDKPVFVYKLICQGTVEEKIQAMQARKAELARAVLEGGASRRLRFDETDLEALFAPL